MSTVKTNRVQLGQSATATQNFTLTAEAADGSMKLARGVAGGTTQDILTINSLGEVDFPQMIRSLGSSGYLKLPSGLILQWGNQNFSGSANTVITFPIAFPNACVADTYLGSGSAFITGITRTNTTRTISAAIYPSSTPMGSGATFTWIAIGY